jgi:hypothetical protein
MKTEKSRRRTVVIVTVCAAALTALGLGVVPRSLWAQRSDCCGSYYCNGCHGESSQARAGQITTMVARFNQFLPGGAQPIPLVDRGVYTPTELAPLVTAGYCADADLENQVGRAWLWNATTRKFESCD